MRTLASLILLLSCCLPALAQDKPAPEPPPPAVDEDLQEEIDELIEELGHRSFKRREAACARLLEIGEQAIPALRKVMNSDELEIRWRARKVLVDLGALVDPELLAGVKQRMAVAADERQPLGQRLAAKQWIVKQGTQGLMALFHVLVEKDYRDRRLVVDIVGRFKHKQMVPLLLKALEDEDSFVASGAAAQLRRLTGQKLPSYDKAKWHAWWKANKKTWTPPDPPENK